MKFLSEAKPMFFKIKRVLVRVDADVDLRLEKNGLVVDEDFRLRSVLPTIHFLQDADVRQIILIGHLGRPKGRVVPELSLGPVADWFNQELGSCQLLSLDDFTDQTVEQSDNQIILLENLRFYPGEEANDEEFSKRLAALADIYIDDAFAVAHRNHASMVGLPKFLPSFLGLRFEAEVKTLTWIKERAKRPIVFVLGGSKQGKLDYIPFLADWVDYLLVGGKLPLLMQKSKINPPKAGAFRRAGSQSYSSKVKTGHLIESGKDISSETVEQFKKIIAQAATVIWAGPMGVYEEKESQRGTFEIAQAIAKSKAFKVAGGGDTHRVLSWLDLWENFDFVSVGGGAMLQFLRDGTLPGIEAITSSSNNSNY